MTIDQNERLLLQKAFSALEAMIAEFRALDLPYGSKAYSQAVGVRNELWQYQSCPTPTQSTQPTNCLGSDHELHHLRPTNPAHPLRPGARQEVRRPAI